MSAARDHRFSKFGPIARDLHDRGILTTAEARALLGIPTGCAKCQERDAAGTADRSAT